MNETTKANQLGNRPTSGSPGRDAAELIAPVPSSKYE